MASHQQRDPALADHLAWLGYVQPDGLVVSAPALVDAQAIIDRAQLADLQRRFSEHVGSLRLTESDTGETEPGVENIQRLVTEFLGWPHDLLVGVDPSCPLPESLYVALPEFQETLHPSWAVKNPKAKEDDSPWILLVQTHPTTADLDKPGAASDRNWHASPAKKFERLLRETGVSIGLLTNGVQFRLIYAPPKENSGSLTFPVGAMAEVSGRLILGAFQLLLGSWTLFTAPSEARLPGLLQRSRDYQASVSEILAEQVLHALYELLRGFEAADERVGGKLLRELAARKPSDIYGGLVAVLLRFVFTLFAEDRGLLPSSGLYVRNYSVHGLFERLRADAERYPDTMDHRFGAWAQLLALFRAIHGGCRHAELKMPARHGHLFDPDRYPFLEGRESSRDPLGSLPLLSDGTVFRILEKLSILEGERVSYRSLSVEEIGSVYQTIMGFAVETAMGTAIALKGKRKNGGVPAAPIIVLEELLGVSAKDRAKWLKEKADTELTGEAEKSLKTAATPDDLLVTLEKKIDRNATPGPVAKGGLVLQPTDERRRSGSHYTPRSFTDPIVRKTLAPVLKRLGANPTPEQILALKICDLAVGSAAFLVETCRQLAEELVKAWRAHNCRPQVPPDETEELLAMRTVAQHCLYGVDRNPMAVDLAKLSLWLVTLAKDHPFTFLDHAIRCGDSLVGLTRQQIEDFTWRDTKTSERHFFSDEVRKRTAAALRERQNLLGLGDDYGTPQLKREKLQKADELLDLVRFIGDAAVTAFFAGAKDKAREAKRVELADRISDYLTKGEIKQRPTEEVKLLRGGSFPVRPFHWEIEFPEVFDRENPGFDAIIGNPPFAGKNTLLSSNRDGYLDFVRTLHEESHGAADLVAHFFRRAFNLVRAAGTVGLIATNTIGQGDTRATGLRWICTRGGVIYAARRRYEWPGQAAVVVSVVWFIKGELPPPFDLDDRKVRLITAYLFHSGMHDNPAVLAANATRSFKGCEIGSLGFVTAPDSPEFVWLQKIQDPKRGGQKLLKPYLGGEDLNSSPHIEPPRYVVDSDGLTFDEMSKFPQVRAFLESGVRPDLLKRREISEEDVEWWHFRRPSLEYREAARRFARVLGISEVTSNFNFAFIPTTFIPAHTVKLFGFDVFGPFAALQSRAHEVWARLMASSMKDDMRYTPSDCFDTFPFPVGFEKNAALEAIGREYYDFRAALMVRSNEGLTKTYNSFHDPEERSPDILKLRELHAAMDAAVLTAYGWADLIPACTCEFLLDYEDEEDDESESKARKRKKPWRYRWPDEVRDEVLARLLKLNAERAEQERIAGKAAATNATAKPKRGKVKKTQGAPAQGDLLPNPQKDLFG